MRNLQTGSQREINKKKAEFAAQREKDRKLQIEAYAKVKGISIERARNIFLKLVKPAD